MHHSFWTRAAGFWIGLGGIALLTLDVAGAASLALGGPPKVYLSIYRKRASRDYIQLKNMETTTIDLSGWILRGSLGDYVIPDGTSIAGSGGRKKFVIDEISASRSEKLELIDEVLSPLTGEVVVDQVRWGCDGGAPAPPAFPDSAALVRAPDPDFFPPQAPPDDETWWTIDLDADFGLPSNTAPQSQLGSSLRINEVRVSLGSDPDSVELFNPFPVPEFVEGWFVTSAAGVVFLNGVVPPFGVAAFPVPNLDLAWALRIDLFDMDGVRVDQKAWCFGPDSECFGSCPDGSSPTNGYTYETSGGGISWFDLPCTIGEPNHLEGEDFCDPVAVPGDEGPEIEVEETGWGAIKTRFR